MKKINVIAHRGANKYAPQNTMPAFEKAVSIGTNGFETDIHFTKDDVAVLCHNYSIEETSDGKGKIRDLSYEQLMKYDFGKYFSRKFIGTKIPTVKQFLLLAKEAKLNVINIEIKSPQDGNLTIADETIALAKEFDVFDKLLISSFSSKILLRAKEVDPECKTAFLYSPVNNVKYSTGTKAPDYAFNVLHADAIHPFYMFVTTKVMQAARKYGLMVNPWTVNDVDDINKMIAYGVDGLITDLPDVCNGVISKYY